MNSKKIEIYQQIIRTNSLFQVTLDQLNELIDQNKKEPVLDHEKLIEIIRGLIQVNHSYILLTAEVTYE